MRTVSEDEWDLSGMRDRDRAQRLLNPPAAAQLILDLDCDAKVSAKACRCRWTWQAGEEMMRCHRAIVIIPISADTFDYLFNGRSGYRAQYYLSITEGTKFNR